MGETTVVGPESEMTQFSERRDGWRCLKVCGATDLNVSGILASVVAPLAKDNISLFAISNWETDFVFVQEMDLERAKTSLRLAEHELLT